MSPLLDRLLDRGGPDDEEPPVEYCLIRESDADGSQQLVEVFDREVGETFVEVDVNPQPGTYRLQERHGERKTYGQVVWKATIGDVEQNDRVDALEEEIAALRSELAEDRTADTAPTFPTDTDELEGELLGHLAQEVGPSQALDRLERLEVARSSGDLANSVDDPTDKQEVIGRILLNSYEQYGDRLGDILDGLSVLADAQQGGEQIDPTALQQAIDREAEQMGVEPDPAAEADPSPEAMADGGDEHIPSIQQAIEEDLEADEEEAEEGEDDE